MTFREYRRKLGFSIRRLERDLGLPRSTLSAYERGHITPSGERLIALANFFGLEPARLLDMLRAGKEANSGARGAGRHHPRRPSAVNAG